MTPMDVPCQELELVSAERHHERLAANSLRSHRQFLDLRIDGTSLRSLVVARAQTPVMADLVTVLVTNWPGGFPDDELLVLLGDQATPLPDGRVPLLICAECGGLGCGTVTAVVQRSDDHVIWRDFGWQTDYDPPVELEPYADIGPFRFDSRKYEDLLRQLLSRR